MKKFNILILIASSFFLINCGGDVGDSVNHTSVLGDNGDIGNPQPFDAPEISQAKIDEYLDAINNARSQGRDCGSEGHFDATTHLQWSNELYKAAYEHSQDMAKSGVFEHDGSGYESDWTAKVHKLNHPSRFYERIVNNGYSYSSVGENIAGGQATTSEVVQGWLDSPHHCANIMNPDFTDIGMAMYYKQDDSKNYHYYWTQDFGGN